MADLETTTSKLRTTPTAGVSGEHSAYYRRLLSAGYKGYIQGSIGGGTLYGSLGLALGTIVALPLMLTPVGIGALWLIPALASTLGIYGAHTFADIGKTAAIIADSADTNEKRRYLLDRYYETPNDLEAQEIKRQLEKENGPKAPEKMFHWRPALVGAAIGITLALASMALLGAGIIPEFLGLEAVLHTVGLTMGAHGLVAAGGIAEAIGVTGAVSMMTGLCAAIGGLAGSVIGIDREHVRRWMDKAEFAVHETSTSERAIAEREHDIQRIQDAAKHGEKLLETNPPTVEQSRPFIWQDKIQTTERAAPISPQAVAGIKDRPTSQVQQLEYADRLVSLDKAVAV